MTRHYFKQGGITRRKPKLPKRPDHAKKAVIVTLQNGQSQFMSSREAAMQVGRSKGGQEAQRRGTGHRFTSETARQASRKLWDTKYRVRTSGRRLGRSRKYRNPVRRQALRLQHIWPCAHCPRVFPTADGVYCWGEMGAATQWTALIGGQHHPISERTALRRLGYLPYPRKGQVPVAVQPAFQLTPGRRPGTKHAHPLITFNLQHLKRGPK